MGEQVSRMPISGFSGLLFSGAPASLQRHEDEEADVQAKLLVAPPSLQRKTDGGLQTTSHFTSQVQSSAGGGAALAPAVQQSMASAFQADFSGVRIHTDTRAAQLSTDIGARAFTYGSDIYFNENQYDATSTDGRFLLAHELTHTVQQGAAVRRAVQPSVGVPTVQAFSFSVIDEAIDWLLKYVNPDAIPGYSLLSVIINYDIFRRRRVEMTAENLVKGLLELVPVFGMLLFNLLQEHQVIGRAFGWVKGELGRLNLTTDRLKNTLQAAWEEIHLDDGIDANLEVLKKHFVALKNDVVSFAESIKNQLLTMLKEALASVLNKLAIDKIAAYPLFTKIVGYDPIAGKEVSAPLEEILSDFLDLIGKKTEREEMEKRGTIKKTADWLRSKLAQFLGLLTQVRALVAHLWEAFSFESLRDPIGTLTGLVNEAKTVIKNVWNFATEVALTVLKFIKDALLGLLKAHANQLPGYHLLTVILEKDPVTNQPVERNAVNLIGGFIDLVAGPEKFAEIKQSGAIEKMIAWLEGAIAKFQITWEGIKKLFTDIWNSFTINDLINPIGAFVRVVGQFREPIGRLVAFVVEVVKKVIYTALQLMNFPFDLIDQIVAKAMQAYEDIKRDPMAFLGNLLKAVKLGFSQFFGHIGTHLLNGLVGWLTSELKKANIKPPKDFTFRSILAFVLDVLGISMDKIWKKLGEHPKIGPQKVAKIRSMIDKLTGIWTFVKEVMEEGPGAIWRHIQEQLANLWNTVLDKVKAWILEQIIDKMVAKLLSMLDPTGIMAVINSFLAFYRAVQSFVERLREILEVVSSFVGGVAEIARGVVTTGANFLERTMANALPTIIGFLANQVGLRNLGGRIGEMIASVQAMVDAGITWLVNKAVDGGLALLNSLFGSSEKPDDRTPQQKEQDLTKGVHEGEALLRNQKKTKPQIIAGLALIKTKYKLLKLDIVVNSEDPTSETDHILGEVNPKLESGIAKRPKVADGSKDRPYPLWWPHELEQAPVASTRPLLKVSGADRDESITYQARLRQRLLGFLIKPEKSNDSLLVKKLRKDLRQLFGISQTADIKNLGDTHFHHIQPLFLNGLDEDSNLTELAVTPHLAGHQRLRTQQGVPGPPEGMPLEVRDLYNNSKHPNGTHYKIGDGF